MQRIRYTKKSGTTNEENVYEWQLLAFIFLRLLRSDSEFFLASNLEAALLFDDIVVRHRKPSNLAWNVNYVQVKFKENNKITITDFLSLSGDYSLVKFCDSYEKIKLSEDLRSYGNVEDHKFTIFTNASIDSSLVNELNESDPVLETGGMVVQFKPDGDVYKGLRDWVLFKKILTDLNDGLASERIIPEEYVDEDVPDMVEFYFRDVTFTNNAVKSWHDELKKCPTFAKVDELLLKLKPVGDMESYSFFLSKLQLYVKQIPVENIRSKITEKLPEVIDCDTELNGYAMSWALLDKVHAWWKKDNFYLTQGEKSWLKEIKSQIVAMSLRPGKEFPLRASPVKKEIVLSSMDFLFPGASWILRGLSDLENFIL